MEEASSSPHSSYKQKNAQQQTPEPSHSAVSKAKPSASSQKPATAFIRSFQPYNPQPQDMMYYGQGLNFPSAMDHHQFVNFNGFPQSALKTEARPSNPRVSVKITHPETKEELKLDEIAKAKGRRTHHNNNVQLQSHHPLFGDHYNPAVNYFPYMQQNPISFQDAFSRMEMFPTAMQFSHSYLDMHGGVVGSNSIHVPSSPMPFKAEFGRAGKRVSSPVSVNSVGNDNNRAIRSRRASRVVSNRGKSKIHPEIDNNPPPKAISVVSTLRANPSGRKTTKDSGFSKKEIKTSSSSDESKLVSSENSAQSSPTVISPPLNDMKQPDSVSEPPLNFDPSRNASKKRYSRKFLLKISCQFVELPTDFELGHEKMKGLISGSESPTDDHGHHQIRDNKKWNKTPVSSSQGGTNVGNSHEWIVDFSSFPQSNSHHHHKGRKNKFPDPSSMARSSLQVMHKADSKYEVRKVTDDEEAKQRQLKAILNKLTPQNFDRLFHQVMEVNICSKQALSGLISQIFDKALMEPTFCEMYANFCWHLSRVLPNFTEGHQKVTFKTLLLNKCQEEFVRSEREEAEEKREEERVRARRRMLGNVRLIGELYKKRMLTERVLRECISKLFGDDHNPDEEDIEALCQLMSTVGEIIDHPKAKDQVDSYFETMKSLERNDQLPSRIRFMLKDVIDLRNNRWKQRRKVEGPKKIEELHSDAAQERRAGVLSNQNPHFTSSYVRKVPGNFDPHQNSRPVPDVHLRDKHQNQVTTTPSVQVQVQVQVPVPVPVPVLSKSSAEKRTTNGKSQHGVSKKTSTARAQAMSSNGYSCSVSKQKPQNIKWQACKATQSTS